MSIIVSIIVIATAIVIVLSLALVIRFSLGRKRADRQWEQARYPKLEDMGSVEHLTILPLIDGKSTRADLNSEPGVSYLIRADNTAILFDVGFNPKGEHPSPLLRNMDALGVELKQFDCIAISHLHADHVGGLGQQRNRTFGISKEPINLNAITALVPEPMTHQTASIEVVSEPRVIAPGIASLGPIARQMFFFGWTPEQPLAVNVQDKGIVLISGCGHPTLRRMVERAETLFDEPLYAVIGGLHYPVTQSRAVMLGLPMQRILGTGKWPWDPVNKKDVEDNIEYLKRRNLRLIALSPHDSCDWSIEAFRDAFGDTYRDLTVGEEIAI
jgi:7,8-dihydropterin-6-yl-methyl-4-(beta-D-ribofuranosyl)aminobenzene 5'-phosphate synthase